MWRPAVDDLAPMTDLTEMVEWLRGVAKDDLAEAQESVAKAPHVSWVLLEDQNDEMAVLLRHASRHDRRDTIARCEAELALIDLHTGVIAPDAPDDQTIVCGTCGPFAEQPGGLWLDSGPDAGWYPCNTIKHLASGYRHRDGYKASWTA